jgi:hypothetical protein
MKTWKKTFSFENKYFQMKRITGPRKAGSAVIAGLSIQRPRAALCQSP